MAGCCYVSVSGGEGLTPLDTALNAGSCEGCVPVIVGHEHQATVAPAKDHVSQKVC